MTNYSHIKLSDTFYPQTYARFPTLYYPTTESSGNLVSSYGVDLPLFGSGACSGNGYARGTFGTSNTSSTNPNPTGFAIENSSLVSGFDTATVAPPFMYEVVFNAGARYVYIRSILGLPRSFFYTYYDGGTKYYVFFDKFGGGSSTALQSQVLELNTSYYIVIACIGTGTNEIRMYVNKVQRGETTYAPTASNMGYVSVGMVVSNWGTKTASQQLSNGLVGKIALSNSTTNLPITTWAGVEAIMNLRMPTTAGALVDYPIAM